MSVYNTGQAPDGITFHDEFFDCDLARDVGNLGRHLATLQVYRAGWVVEELSTSELGEVIQVEERVCFECFVLGGCNWPEVFICCLFPEVESGCL